MRNICAALWLMLTVALGGSLIWILYGVLSQPVYGSEPVSLKDNGLLKPGYITPYRASQKPVTVTRGRISTYGTPSGRIYLKTYDKGTYTITSGRIGMRTIRVKEYKLPQE